MAPDALSLLLLKLRDAFPRQAKDYPRETFAEYKSQLQDLPYDAVHASVNELIRTSEFFPSVRAIREAACERVLALPSRTQALSQIEARIRWQRLSDGEKEASRPVVHPLVQEALDLVGGYYAWKTTDNPAVIRGQFSKAYDELRGQAIRDAQIGTLMIEGGDEPTRRVA